MQRHQRTRQARVRQPGDQSGLDAGLLVMVDQPAQQLDQHHLEQPVGQQAVAATHLFGLGEQQRQGLFQPRHARQRQGDQRRQGAHHRIARAAVEIQRRAGEIRSLHGRVVEHVVDRARIEQQRRFLEAQPPRQPGAGRMAQFQFTPPQHMQEATARLRGELRQPAQRPLVKQVRAGTEALQQRGQAVDLRIHDGLDELICMKDVSYLMVRDDQQ
ncbi:hypothetical protein D3C81_1384880 [compost metagenome]